MRKEPMYQTMESFKYMEQRTSEVAEDKALYPGQTETHFYLTEKLFPNFGLPVDKDGYISNVGLAKIYAQILFRHVYFSDASKKEVIELLRDIYWECGLLEDCLLYTSDAADD